MDKLRVMITDEERKLVMRIAKKAYSKYCPAGESGQFTIEDIFHLGIVGLCEAKKNFDPSKGVPWLKFASYRIHGAMLDSIRKAPLIRLPQDQYRKVKEVGEAQAKLSQAGKDTSPESLADVLKWPVAEVLRALNLLPKLISTENDRKDTDDEITTNEVVLPDEGENPEKVFMNRELAEVMEKCMEKLSENLRIVLKARLIEDMKLKDLADIFSCSMESIRQKQLRAQKQMQACLAEHGWSLNE